jgi:hypothetical protein
MKRLAMLLLLLAAPLLASDVRIMLRIERSKASVSSVVSAAAALAPRLANASSISNNKYEALIYRPAEDSVAVDSMNLKPLGQLSGVDVFVLEDTTSL